MAEARPARRSDNTGEPTATLAEVDILAQLDARRRRPPDYEKETRALASLAAELARNPRNMLQKLVETAVELCNADTAGLSLLEGEIFRWEAVAGATARASRSRWRSKGTASAASRMDTPPWKRSRRSSPTWSFSTWDCPI